MADILGFPHGPRPGDAYDTMPSECNPNEVDEPAHKNPQLRERILDEAKQLVSVDRHDQHGAAEVNLGLTGDLWTAWSGRQLSAHDVAMMNILQKISRILAGHHNVDNYVDIAGYAALAGELAHK